MYAYSCLYTLDSIVGIEVTDVVVPRSADLRISGSVVVGFFVTFLQTYVFVFVLYAKREVCYFMQGLCKGWFANLQDIKVKYKT